MAPDVEQGLRGEVSLDKPAGQRLGVKRLALLDDEVCFVEVIHDARSYGFASLQHSGGGNY